MTPDVTSSRSSAQAARVLYGRQNARKEFLEVFKGVVATSTPTTVLVVGEGGMGKTRFLIEVEAALRNQYPNVAVAYGRALAQHSESNGFQPIREALLDLVFEAKREKRDRLVRRIAGTGLCIR
jgi:Cdc6-like AAA superfamily ATPase